MHTIDTLHMALITLSFVILILAELKVTQVQVLFRHGDRTPLPNEMFPNDIYNLSTYEPWGIGQLTDVGMMREYKIGQVLKNRYKDLLDPHYRHSTVYAVSTATHRTKMSLQLVLAALFPPSKQHLWNPELQWMPIPIHYVPKAIDILLESNLCPEYINALAEVKRLPEIREKIAAFDDLYQYLSANAGMSINGTHPVYRLYNIFISQRGMNLTLPDWVTESVFEEMADVTDLEYLIRTYTMELKRLQGGFMVRKFIENMHLDREPKNIRKIYLYSGHEINIATFLRSQGISEPKIPLYGTAVMFEKLLDDNENRFIRMVMWTGVTEQLITVRLPGCEEICPMETYLELTREIIPSDDEMDCHWRRLSRSELRSILEEQNI